MEWICVKCQAYNKSWLSKNCKQCHHVYGATLPVAQQPAKPTPQVVEDEKPPTPEKWAMDHDQMLLGLQAIWEQIIILREDIQTLAADLLPPGPEPESPPTPETPVPPPPLKKRGGRPKKDAS